MVGSHGILCRVHLSLGNTPYVCCTLYFLQNTSYNIHTIYPWTDTHIFQADCDPGCILHFPTYWQNPLFHRNQHVRMLASRQAIYSQSRQAPVPAKPQWISQRTRLGNPVLSCSHLGIAISFSRVEAGRQQRIPWNSFVILGGCPRTWGASYSQSG